MADFIVGVVTSIAKDEYQGKEFLRVTLGTGQELKVKQGREGALKEKWGLLQEGRAIKFTFSEYTNPEGVKFPFVSNIETVEGALPPPVTSKLSEEAQALLPNPAAYAEKAPIPAKPAPAPQEIGMFLKEAGELIRMPQEEALKLVKPDMLKAIRTAYFAKMFTVLDIRVEKQEQ